MNTDPNENPLAHLAELVKQEVDPPLIWAQPLCGATKGALQFLIIPPPLPPTPEQIAAAEGARKAAHDKNYPPVYTLGYAVSEKPCARPARSSGASTATNLSAASIVTPAS